MLTLVLPKFESDTFIYISNKAGEEDITILNDDTNASNFKLVGNDDLVMTAGAVYVFLYDSVSDVYREISTRVSGAGSEVFTWTADHSADGNDLNSLKSIVYSLGGASMVSSASGLVYDVGSGNNHNIKVNTSTVMTIAASAVTVAGNIAMVGGGISASDSIVTSGAITMSSTNTMVGSSSGIITNVATGDDHDFAVNSSIVLSIAAGAVTMVGSFAVISGGVTSDFLTTTGDISSSTGDLNLTAGSIVFGSATPLSSSDVGWTGSTGDIYGNIQTNDSYFFRENGSVIVEMDNDGIDVRTGWYEMTEISTVAALSNHVRLYARDNGAGKTQFMARVGSTNFIMATEI